MTPLGFAGYVLIIVWCGDPLPLCPPRFWSRILFFFFAFSRFFVILTTLWMPLRCIERKPARCRDRSPYQHRRSLQFTGNRLCWGVQHMKYSEPGLLEGFVLCLWDSEFIRTQTSKWKRKLLVFSSGVCLEIAGAPLVGASLGYDFTWLFWLVSFLFLPMGLLGIYASKFGTDRLVERLLVVPQLDLKI
jgi:hypothetical protein